MEVFAFTKTDSWFLNFFVLLAVVTSALAESSSKQVTCEKEEASVCLMNGTTSIHSNGVVIANEANENIVWLVFKSNEDISHLPIEVSRVFPNLFAYDASYCSIEMLSRENFINLNKLEYLWLRDNMVKEIDSDTFKDLNTLVLIDLADNLIIFLSGELFAGLDKLIFVGLSGNTCISKDFQGKGQVLTSLEVISEECGPKESMETKLRETLYNITQERNHKQVLLEKCGCKEEN